ncbi:hypothetical protein SNEBB_002008 [Seison nebaliae]|nr:hypothetical protein SNEBB_002008 [Seison nebaliae]
MVFLKSSNGFLYLKNEIKGNLEKYLREILNKSTTSGCREIKWLSSEDLNGMNMPTNLDMWLHLNSIDTTMNSRSIINQ